MPQRDGGDERRGWFALTREKTGKKGKEIKLLGEREEKKKSRLRAMEVVTLHNPDGK